MLDILRESPASPNFALVLVGVATAGFAPAVSRNPAMSLVVFDQFLEFRLIYINAQGLHDILSGFEHDGAIFLVPVGPEQA